MATYAPNQLHSVPLAELQPNPTQPRKYFDPLALEELTASISQVAVPTVPKNVLIMIARNKQQRSMVTQFQLYRKQQAQAGVKKTPGVKRTKAETLVNNVDATGLKIAALNLQEFSTTERDLILATLTALRDTLNEAFDRAAQ